jgi:hypothetical protein
MAVSVGYEWAGSGYLGSGLVWQSSYGASCYYKGRRGEMWSGGAVLVSLVRVCPRCVMVGRGSSGSVRHGMVLYVKVRFGSAVVVCRDLVWSGATSLGKFQLFY